MYVCLLGIDGPTDTTSRFVGWFVNGSYSVYLWLPTARQLYLGFGEQDEAGADPAQDNVLVATNDVLLVERGGNRIGVTWQDRTTIVGFVEGATRVALQEAHACKYAPLLLRLLRCG